MVISRPAMLLVAAAALLGAGTALSADPPPCPPTDRLPVPQQNFWAARTSSLLVDLSLIADWDATTGKSHPAFGMGFEYNGVLDSDQRFRLGPRVGFQIGRWGDDLHNRVSIDPGLRFRGSFYMDPVVDVYAIVKTDMMVALGSPMQLGVRPGAGFGLRIARAVNIEATFDIQVAVGDPFTQGTGTSTIRWVPGLWFGGAFDLCTLGSFCNRKVPAPVIQDTSINLYDEAHAICEETKSAAQHQALCAAVDTAIDGDRYPPSPDQDSTDAFLDGLRRELESAKQPELAKLIATLDKHHRDMALCRKHNLDASRVAQQTDQDLAIHYTYSTFPVVIRRALGCGPDRPKTTVECPAVTEGKRPAKP